MKNSTCLVILFVLVFSCGSAYAANAANFVSQSVPTTMYVGATASVSVTMKNPSPYSSCVRKCGLYCCEDCIECYQCYNVCSGTVTPNSWTYPNYKLGSQNPQDNAIWGTGRVLLNSGETIASGAQKTFNFQITAPSTPGAYNFQWRMVQEGVEWFGDLTPNVVINVIARPAATTTTTRPPTTTSAPSLYTISGRVTRNTGSGISGVGMELCNGLSATTDYNGYWSKSVSPGTYFCVRAVSGLPGGYTSIVGTRNNACHTGYGGYEWQVSGQNAYQSCAYSDQRSWDLNMDTGLDIVVYYPTTTTRPPTTTTTTTTTRPSTTTTTAPTASVVFQYRATDDHKVAACTIWTDVFGPWQKYKTDTEIENDAVNEFVMDGIPPGTYRWSVSCIDDVLQGSVLKNAPKEYWVFTVSA